MVCVDDIVDITPVDDGPTENIHSLVNRQDCSFLLKKFESKHSCYACTFITYME